MAKDRPRVADVVVAFQAPQRHAAYLSATDRMEIVRWRDAARAAGFDRMVIYEREDSDDAEIGDFACLHVRGEPWSRWGIARKNNAVIVWCCLTGADVGEFPTLSAALGAIIHGTETADTPEPHLATITDLMPRLRQATSFGSAA